MVLLKKQNVDATTGPLLQKIIIYTIPLLLTTLIQQLFNAVDIVVLGNMADSTAVASVAATNSVISLIVTAFFCTVISCINILRKQSCLLVRNNKKRVLE